MPGPTYELVLPTAARATGPRLDDDQRRVVEHDGGPLLVLAGPGTGKTTTLVEAIVDRVERRGADPSSILALTFSRKAAEQLRDRVTARLGRTVEGSVAATFHSFAYGLVRTYAPGEQQIGPLRLMTAPEQETKMRQLLTTEAESVRWPAEVAGAVGTRGFVREVATVLARAQERGLGYLQLRALGEAEGVPAYVAAAAFMEQYDDALLAENLLDYPGLIAGAARLLQDPESPARDDLRRRYQHVFVDEYQDTDPAQVAMLRAIAGDGRDLIAVGDPHQSIYGFRGADVTGIESFPDRFRTVAGDRAPVVVLSTTRRFGTEIHSAARRVARRLSLRGALAGEAQRFLDNRVLPDAPTGRVEVTTYDNERAETEHLADLLRRAHLEDDVAWSDMAVLVRSGRASIPRLRRALAAAGVPVEVAADETPLVMESAVLPLLDALRAVVNLDNDDPFSAGYLHLDRAAALLVSPLVGLDAIESRALARELRGREQARDRATGEPAKSSPELLRDALLVPDSLAGLRSSAARRAADFAGLLREARTELDAGATAEEVLWVLWSRTDWPARLRSATERGGGAARLAHRDLDAVCALFETAARAEEQRGHTSVESFLDSLAGQQIPADTLAERGVRGDAVRLLTAHRAKGLEWPLVVVAHVQEQAWPDLRRRATLLQADRIDRDGLRAPFDVRAVLAEERRLFYVGCTRARERLVVTAVASPDDEGEQPSRFLGELLPTPPEGTDDEAAGRPPYAPDHVRMRPARPLSLPGLVAELRRTVADESRPDALRQAAARRLARLAAERAAGRPVVPHADPARWWGLHVLSEAPSPLHAVDAALPLTASTLTTMQECPARWFLEREAGGADAASQAQGFGNIAHALADRIARGELSADSPTLLEEVMAHVDRVWEQLPFRTPWSAERERVELRAALDRFLAHHRASERELLATERRIEADVELPDGSLVRLHGYADRIELDRDGTVVVVDLKTGKYAAPKIDENPQLGLYRLAVDNGATAELSGDAPAGAAELWQLRQSTAAGDLKVQRQAPQQPGDDGSTMVERQLMGAVAAIRAESFPATPGGHCERCAFVRLCPAKTSGTVLH